MSVLVIFPLLSTAPCFVRGQVGVLLTKNVINISLFLIVMTSLASRPGSKHVGMKDWAGWGGF